MAGTRRRSRAADSAHTDRRQPSASDATSVIEQTPLVVPDVTEVVESAGDASPRPDTPTSRSTKGFCKKCGTNIGEYYNSWHKITGTYYMPALLGSYQSLLRNSGEQKAASIGTAIEGCTIQPLSCPAFRAPTASEKGFCSDSPIGFTVVEAPVGKKNFRGRDFFKLGRIELRCKVSSNKTIVVEPQEDTALDLSTVNDSNSPSPVQASSWRGNAMEVDSRPSPSQHAGHHHGHTGQQHERIQPHQPVQQTEVNRQSLPPPSVVASPTMLAPLHSVPPKASNNPLPSISPAVRPHDLPYSTQPSPMESGVGPASRRNFPMGGVQRRSPGEPHSFNGSPFPRPSGEVTLDAIERLQTQISQNSGALAAHTRDIRRGEESFQQLEATLRREFAARVQHQTIDIQRVDEAVTRLHLEMQGMRQALENVSHELAINRAEIQRGGGAPPGQPVGVPDAALELMAQQVAVMSHKTSELDNLRVTVEIMKKKIHYLEQGAKPTKPAPALQANAHISQPSHGSVPSQVQTTSSVHATPVAIPRSASPLQTPSVPSTYQSLGPPSSTAMPDVAQNPEFKRNQNAEWVSINAGTKRTHVLGMESPREGAVDAHGSPKRQKVAAVEHAGNTPLQIHSSQQSFERRDTENSDPRFHPPPSTMPAQLSIPESILASQTQQSTYTPYATQEAPSDDSWRPESQRTAEHRPRGRGRGGGPGSRGGRPRKSLPTTPAWNRDNWQNMSEIRAGPEGYPSPAARSGRGIARRGSGGGGRGGYAQSERATSLGSQGVSPGFSIGSPNDPYAHTKKTRTKPIRNADGVLIRKDGRPDMRSQSSAANLRKVHSRKDGEQSAHGSPTGFTPINPHHAVSADAPDTPSPGSYGQMDEHAPSSVQRKHNAIMGKMFPSGVDESRRQNDYAHQVFEEDRDHTAHPRNQNHIDPQVTRAGVKIKKEQPEQHRVIQDSMEDGGVDLDHDERDHADSEQQTPSEHREQFHDASTGEQLEAQSTQGELEPMVPETQAVDMEQ